MSFRAITRAAGGMAFFSSVGGVVHIFQTKRDAEPACGATVSPERTLPEGDTPVCEQCQFCSMCWAEGGALRYAGARS
jgi:hypothetical protein